MERSDGRVIVVGEAETEGRRRPWDGPRVEQSIHLRAQMKECRLLFRAQTLPDLFPDVRFLFSDLQHLMMNQRPRWKSPPIAYLEFPFLLHHLLGLVIAGFHGSSLDLRIGIGLYWRSWLFFLIFERRSLRESWEQGFRFWHPWSWKTGICSSDFRKTDEANPTIYDFPIKMAHESRASRNRATRVDKIMEHVATAVP